MITRRLICLVFHGKVDMYEDETEMMSVLFWVNFEIGILIFIYLWVREAIEIKKQKTEQL
jgi:uncharacterized membrane protein YciS (DUF1049 family)